MPKDAVPPEQSDEAEALFEKLHLRHLGRNCVDEFPMAAKAEAIAIINEALSRHVQARTVGLVSSLDAAMTINRGAQIINAELEARIGKLVEALRSAEGTLGYIRTQAKLNHTGFNMVAKQNCDMAISKICAALAERTK